MRPRTRILNELQVICNSDFNFKLRPNASNIDQQNFSDFGEVVLTFAHFDRDQVCAPVDANSTKPEPPTEANESLVVNFECKMAARSTR